MADENSPFHMMLKMNKIFLCPHEKSGMFTDRAPTATTPKAFDLFDKTDDDKKRSSTMINMNLKSMFMKKMKDSLYHEYRK